MANLYYKHQHIATLQLMRHHIILVTVFMCHWEWSMNLFPVQLFNISRASWVIRWKFVYIHRFITPGDLSSYKVLYHLSSLHIETVQIIGQGYYSHKHITVMSLCPQVILVPNMDHTMKICTCWLTSPPPSPHRGREVSMSAEEAHVSLRWIVM